MEMIKLEFFCTLGAFLVNTGSCQLLDDCAVKQLLIDGTIAGCAIDGAEGPQWMEAWVWISFPFVSAYALAIHCILF